MDKEQTQSEQLPDRPDFITELTGLINKYSLENHSNTPDFILSKYLQRCLGVWTECVTHRDKWYGFKPFEATDSPTSDNPASEHKTSKRASS